MLRASQADFTPVCTTELGTVASLAEQFASRGVKLAALSCEGADSHRRWIKDIEAADWAKGAKVDFPIIADPDREIATKYGMLDPEEKDAAGLPMACRAVFVVKPDKTLALSILYPATTGRNFAEVRPSQALRRPPLTSLVGFVGAFSPVYDPFPQFEYESRRPRRRVLKGAARCRSARVPPHQNASYQRQ